jgi:hypothetical protein
MGKLYNFEMPRCTTLLEKLLKRLIDLEFDLLGRGYIGLPSPPKPNSWQIRRQQFAPRACHSQQLTSPKLGDTRDQTRWLQRAVKGASCANDAAVAVGR